MSGHHRWSEIRHKTRAPKICFRCQTNPRWNESDWCRLCVWEVCCSRYPRVVHDEVREFCMHRVNRDHPPIQLADYLAEDEVDRPT